MHTFKHKISITILVKLQLNLTFKSQFINLCPLDGLSNKRLIQIWVVWVRWNEHVHLTSLLHLHLIGLNLHQLSNKWRLRQSSTLGFMALSLCRSHANNSSFQLTGQLDALLHMHFPFALASTICPFSNMTLTRTTNKQTGKCLYNGDPKVDDRYL